MVLGHAVVTLFHRRGGAVDVRVVLVITPYIYVGLVVLDHAVEFSHEVFVVFVDRRGGAVILEEESLGHTAVGVGDVVDCVVGVRD